ncbi:hypothetical protein V9T40_014913 [Parthenolecanium corni]|uniref:Uncharacterized protein n=1 Tax=Parthenolecanium corni TaxID=536013 RepID=A0AAN9TLT0_9HEMI
MSGDENETGVGNGALNSEDPLIDLQSTIPPPPPTTPTITFADGNTLEFPAQQQQGIGVAGTSAKDRVEDPLHSQNTSNSDISQNGQTSGGLEKTSISHTKTQAQLDEELENQKAVTEYLILEQTKRIKEITENLQKHADLAATMEVSLENLKKIAVRHGLDPDDLPGSLARQVGKVASFDNPPNPEVTAASAAATQTSTPITIRNPSVEPERRPAVRFSENFTTIHQPPPASNTSSDVSSSSSQNTGSPIIAGNQATPRTSQQPITSNPMSIPTSQPVPSTSMPRPVVTSVPVTSQHQPNLYSIPPPIVPSVIPTPMMNATQLPDVGQPAPYQPYGTNRVQNASFHPVFEPDPNQLSGQDPSRGIAMKINMQWKPDVTAAPVMAPLEYGKTTPVPSGNGGNGGQHPSNVPASIFIPPSSVQGTGQPIHLYLHQPSSNYTSKYFDPTKLQPYRGRADTRSPISFIREFEHCTSGISDNIVRGKLFIRAFDRDHFQTAKSYRFDAGFVHLKDQFLKTEWNDNCKQQILLEIENAVYDHRRYDSIADFIIDIYSKMFDCQLPILSIHSKIMRKAPVYYSGQLKPKHCATFETFSEKVRSLHATYGAFDATMQLPPVNPYAIKPPVHRAAANTSSRNQEAIFYVDQVNPDPDSESDAEVPRHEEFPGNDF